MRCFLKAIAGSEEMDLGSFQMIEDPEGVMVGGSFTTGFFSMEGL